MIKFDLEKLKELIEHIYKLSKIKVSIYNEKREEILYYPYKYSTYCGIVRKDEKINKQCINADNERFDLINKYGRAEIFKCPMGLTEIFSPIIVSGITVGYMTLGQSITSDEDKKVMIKQAIKNHIDEEEITQAIKDTEIIPEELIKASSAILDACTKYVYIENYINISDDELMVKIIKFIEEHLDEKITTDSLCKEFYISRVNLYKIFHEYTHLTVANYVKSERIKKAKSLLSTTSKSVKEVAQEIGQDYNYFSKIFYKETNMTPKKFQKNNGLLR